MSQTNAAETFERFAVVEEWRPIPEYRDIYEVSSRGRVRRVGKAAQNGRARGGGVRIGRILKAQNAASGGYLSVQLWADGKPKMCLVHRLVAAAFIGPCPLNHEVNHRNGDKASNAVGNLEYVTRSENNEHAYRIGLRQVTERQRRTLGNSRRKPRSIVTCACGCGMELETPAPYGRDRKFINGHNPRKTSKRKDVSR